jgi:hypothetical protein
MAGSGGGFRLEILKLGARPFPETRGSEGGSFFPRETLWLGEKHPAKSRLTRL